MIIATITLVWEALGSKLAYARGQRGTGAEWIGGELQITDGILTAEVKKAIIDDITMMLDQFSRSISSL